MKTTVSPLISVITPFLNVEAYLPETIESVIHQEYQHWELILIDDGSSDSSTAIAKRYASHYPGKILYVEHENHANKGAAASRNLGVANASGVYLAFLDSDDVFLPQKLKEQVELMQQHQQVGAICEATKYWYTWFNPQLKDKVIPTGAPTDKMYEPPYLAKALYPLGKGASFCTCGLMMRTASFRALGGFDESFTGTNQLYEDQVLFVKICLHETVYLSSSCYNWYRQRANSLMHGLRSEGHDAAARLFFLNWLQNYLKSRQITDPDINRALKKAVLLNRYPLVANLQKRGRRIKKKVASKIKLLFNL